MPRERTFPRHAAPQQHTTLHQIGHTIVRFLNTRPKKIAVAIGSCLAVAGIALAAFLLTSTIGGSVSFADSTADFAVSDASGTKTAGGMDCSAVSIGSNGKDLTINPVVSRATSPGQSPQVVAQNCTVTIKVKNTGSQALTVAGFELTTPNGVTVSDANGEPTVGPGATVTYSGKFNVAEGADVEAGPIQGKLTLTG